MRGQIRRRWPNRPGVVALRIAVVGVAVLIAAFGLGSLLPGRQAPARVAGAATIDGLTATPHQASWMSMDHAMSGSQPGGMGGMGGGEALQNGQDDQQGQNGQGGYQMPAQMMPGAPADGELRLGVPVTLANESEKVREFDLVKEFSLAGGPGDDTSRLNSDTFGGLARLNPGSAVDGVLYFDVKSPVPGDPPLYLKWTRGGSQDRLAVRIAAGQPAHPHGP